MQIALAAYLTLVGGYDRCSRRLGSQARFLGCVLAAETVSGLLLHEETLSGFRPERTA